MLEALHRETGGGRYWRRVLRTLAREMAADHVFGPEEAYQCVSRKFAIIEACAYHSRRSPGDWTDDLPSSRAAKAFVHDLCAGDADREILIFIWRKARFWDIDSCEESGVTVIRRPPKQAIGKYPYERERRAIREFLLRTGACT